MKNIDENSNPNGSLNNIAGIFNSEKNILGMMPHPKNGRWNNITIEKIYSQVCLVNMTITDKITKNMDLNLKNLKRLKSLNRA